MMAGCDFTFTRWTAWASFGILFGLAICKIEKTPQSDVTASIILPKTVLPLQAPLPAMPLPLNSPSPKSSKPILAPPIPTPTPTTPPTTVSPPEAAEPPSQAILEPKEVMDFIEMFEGVRYRVYQDSQGYQTVGIGLNLDAPGAASLLNKQGISYRSVYSGNRRLSKEEVYALFQRQVEDAMDAARRLLDDFESHPKDVQLAVTDMIFNLGPSGFNRMRVIYNLDAGRYDRVARHLRQTHWYRQVKDRAERVIALIEGASEPKVAMVP